MIDSFPNDDDNNCRAGSIGFLKIYKKKLKNSKTSQWRQNIRERE